MVLRTIKIFCKNCETQLYQYKKGGKGQLVKVQQHRIVKDFTTERGVCPNCQVQFARPQVIKGRPSNKIIGDKVFWS